MDKISAENLITEAEKELTETFAELEKIALFNQEKVLNAFRENQISARHFYGSTGYGYNDSGRDSLGRVYASIFGTEEAIVSTNIASGTHALKIALYGVLRPGDTMLSISGKPYDTLDKTIAGVKGEDIGSLRDFGVKYLQVDLNNGKFDKAKIIKLAQKKPKLIYIQRSKGYEWRDALSVFEIEEIITEIKKVNKTSIIMVDNCYGEFVQTKEPTDVGADVVIGSLIKNPGAGLAPNGGYIAGKKFVIDSISASFTSPSLKLEVSSYEQGYRLLYQGIFLAPHIVLQALKGSALIGKIMQKLGYEVLPKDGGLMCDIIRSIKFNKKEELIAFCQEVQYNSPVDSYVTPEPGDMPGYNHQVIMAAGTFVQGSSIELSCDAPIKPPYILYIQGGLTYEHIKIAFRDCLKKL